MTSPRESQPRPRLRPLAVGKLLAVFAVVLPSVMLPLDHWPAVGALAAITLAGLALAGMPLTTLLRRLAVFLPLIALLSLSMPLSQPDLASGWNIAALVSIRATLSLLAGLWLARVMPFEELLSTLRGLYVPDVLVASLAFMHRYVFVLWEELERMRAARRARRFGREGLVVKWTGRIGLIGMLVIRSLDRGDRVHRAMLARGWDGRYRTWQ